jgi:hypothetical protein
MLEAKIPQELAQEARMNSTTLQEANAYVLEEAKDMDIKLVWPDS